MTGLNTEEIEAAINAIRAKSDDGPSPTTSIEKVIAEDRDRGFRVGRCNTRPNLDALDHDPDHDA